MAVILSDYDAVFFHIPKTGGCWVEEALKNSGLKTEWAETCNCVSARHAIPSQVKGEFEYQFTFIRHPLAWYKSVWQYVKQNNATADEYDMVQSAARLRSWHPYQSAVQLMHDDFDKFVRRMVKHNSGFLSWMYRIYIGPRTHRLTELVGRTESLADDLVTVLNVIGCQFDEQKLRNTPRVNVSKVPAPKMTKELEKIIIQSEKSVIKDFIEPLKKQFKRIGVRR